MSDEDNAPETQPEAPAELTIAERVEAQRAKVDRLRKLADKASFDFHAANVELDRLTAKLTAETGIRDSFGEIQKVIRASRSEHEQEAEGAAAIRSALGEGGLAAVAKAIKPKSRKAARPAK